MVGAGFVVAASDYRFSGEALYPAAIEDTADALRLLRDNADRFGIDPSRVVLFGQSGGGYLAARRRARRTRSGRCRASCAGTR